MTASQRLATLFIAVVTLAVVGCGGRSYSRSMRRLAPFGIRAGWVDFLDFEVKEVEDRPLAGLYLRTSLDGAVVIELAADAAIDMDAPEEHTFYAAGASILYFPRKYGNFYLHAGGGAMGEATGANDYMDGYASAGLGYTAPRTSTRIDLRATMWQMIDSSNVTRAANITIGLGF